MRTATDAQLWRSTSTARAALADELADLREQLGEVIVHSQDVRFPLGIDTGA